MGFGVRGQIPIPRGHVKTRLLHGEIHGNRDFLDSPGRAMTLRHAMKPLLALILAFFPLALAAAEEKPVKGIDINLVPETTAIVRGKPFTVGVKIHHHEGFHTYWKNPGIAGVPVKLQWELPEGFSAGPIQWPYPEKTLMAIHPVHGFERDVMLLVEITPPAEIRSARVTLKASASWMACADGCYPGKKTLSCEVPVAPEATVDPAVAGAFQKAREELPQPLQGWSAELLSAPGAQEIRFRLTPAAGNAAQPGELYFFSSDGQISSAPPQRVVKTDSAYEIAAERSPYGPKSKSSLPGVLISSTPFTKDGPKFATIEPRAAGAEVTKETVVAPAAEKECDCGKE
jgi:DsbC/DsbD-like thiol-disulfide interchange protein